MREQRIVAGVRARVLRSLSDDHSQRFDLLMKPDDSDAATALLASLSSDPSWDVLELRDAPVVGATVDTLLNAASAAGFPTGRWAAMRSPALSLASSRAVIHQRLTPRFRANLSRRRRHLQRDVGPIGLERVPNAAGRAALDPALDDTFRLEAAGWKGAAGTAIAADWRLAERYRRIAYAFAEQGTLALSFLTVGGQRKAVHFALFERGVYYLFKPGYDPALARYGPGHLLIQEVVEDLIDRGARELDFLGDCDAWKLEWTDTVRPHAWRYVFAPTPFGRALAWWKLRVAPRLNRVVRR
jgi:CelD/BcsL family acetyltransferase involved in cellulose biosynthesis